jgi:hypothetical protein
LSCLGSNKVRFIGDIHAKIPEYLAITDTCERSVQVGDFGVGFYPTYMLDPWELAPKHRFIRGNHDDPGMCPKLPNWIPDGTLEDGIMYIGGAWSIDHAWRMEGVDWWRDEEVSMSRFQEIIDLAIRAKPRVMVTHDCPTRIVPELFYQEPINTLTQNALERIREEIEPEYWVFGHWHKNVMQSIGGTTFICLAELSYIDLEVYKNERE